MIANEQNIVEKGKKSGDIFCKAGDHCNHTYLEARYLTFRILMEKKGVEYFNRPFHWSDTVQVNRNILLSVVKRIRNLNIPIELQLYLFDHVILPAAVCV